MKMLASSLALVSSTLLLAGCATQNLNETETRATEQFERTQQDSRKAQEMKPRPSRITENDGYFLLGNARKIDHRERLPDFMHEEVELSLGDEVTIRDFASLVSRHSGERVSITDDALFYMGHEPASVSDGSGTSRRDEIAGRIRQGEASGGNDRREPEPDEVMAATREMAADGMIGAPEMNMEAMLGSGADEGPRTFSIDYSGPLVGLFDEVARQTDLYWAWEGDHIELFRQRTMIYRVDVNPVSSSIMAETSTDRSADDDGGSSATRQDTEYEYQTNRAIDDIEQNILGLINDEGFFHYSESQGVLTLVDTPEVHNRVSSYIDTINRVAGKNIGVKIQVFEVAMNEQAAYGLDMNALFDGTNISAELASTFASSLPNLSFASTSGSFEGSMARLDAENNDFRFSTVTEQTSVTKNQTPVSVQLVDEIGYLRQVTVTVEENGTSVELVPGELLEGVTMSLLPRALSDGSIDLKVMLDISQINSIDEFAQGESRIQLPNRTTKDFVNILNAENGKPQLVAAFDRSEDSAETTSLAKRALWFLGGNRSATKERVINLVVATPYIM